MTSLNKVYLAGNLTRDPELRQTSTGRAVGDVGLAVTESYRNKAGEQVETTCFVDVVIWGKTAEACNQHLAKGSAVLVEGRLELDAWESAQGEKRNRLRVRADRVQFLSAPRSPKPAPAGENRNLTRNPAPAKPNHVTEDEQETVNF